MKERLKAALTEALNDLFIQLDKLFYDDMIHNFIYYFGVNYYAQYCEPGFDLLVSNDGVNFDAITRDGFGDGENHGLRTIGSTEQGVYMGTANPFQGTQLWRMYSDRDLPLDTDENATRYNITVISDGNGTASASQTTAVEGKYINLTATANEGSTFEGWEVISPAGLEISNGMFRMPNDDVEIIAHFTEDIDPGDGETEYTLSFETNGGSSIEPVIAKEGEVVDLSKYTTSKAGFTFDGWYSDQSLTDKISSVTITEDTTVYAGWTENSGSEPTDPTQPSDPTDPSDPSDPSGQGGKPSDTNTPQTGDTSNLRLWCTLAVVSLIGVCAAMLPFKKVRNNK